jgi:hypothetical protein
MRSTALTVNASGVLAGRTLIQIARSGLLIAAAPLRMVSLMSLNTDICGYATLRKFIICTLTSVESISATCALKMAG